MPLQGTITSLEKIVVMAVPTADGINPAPVDGPVLFVVESGDCTIEPVDDFSAYIVSGSVGESVILVSADADLGNGVETLSDTITMTVISPKATSLGLSLGTPEPKNP